MLPENSIDKHSSWSPTGEYFVTREKNKLNVWGADGGLRVTLDHEHVQSAHWSPDGQQLIALAGEARIWSVSPSLILRELWEATPYCLSTDRRMRMLGESAVDAERSRQECQSMSRCIRDEAGVVVPDRYSKCLARMQAEQATR